MTEVGATLCKAGFALFVFGLLQGAMIPRFRSARLGIASHATAAQGGTAVMVIGLIWPQLSSGVLASALLGHAIWASMWALCLGMMLAAAFGASKVLPIAGAGIRASPAQEHVVAALIVGSSLVLTLATLATMLMWFSGGL